MDGDKDREICERETQNRYQKNRIETGEKYVWALKMSENYVQNTRKTFQNDLAISIKKIKPNSYWSCVKKQNHITNKCSNPRHA